jgi:TRAP-type C4-dicarboxylate transport system permease small subunit
LGLWVAASDLLFLEEDAKLKTSWQMLLALVEVFKEGMVVRSGFILHILKAPLYLIISLVVDRVNTLVSLYLASATLIIASVNWQL